MQKFDWQTSLDNLGIYTTNEIKRLNILGIFTLLDILLYLPIRYEDKTHITPIADIRIGDKVLLEARVVAAHYIKNKTKNYLVKIEDKTASLTLRFINIYPNLVQKLIAGANIRAYGEVRRGFNGAEIVHPQITFLRQNNTILEQNLTPIYSTSANIRQKNIRESVRKALDYCSSFTDFYEVLPKELLEKYNLPSILTALEIIHFPNLEIPKPDLLNYKTHAQTRLILEELLARQFNLKLKRNTLKSNFSASVNFDDTIEHSFLNSLKFTPTNAQIRACNDIYKDIAQKQPMLRLLQGDVGSGKTLVAGLTILQVINSGYQATLMAPTEILATQHYNTFCNWFNKLGFEVALLTGNLNSKQKRDTLKKIELGVYKIIVGTHAIIQKDVKFSNLALSIIDEQHRFGVKQREELFSSTKNKENLFPHQLIMTATPIPRTLAMSMYADLDLSILDELPAGRKAIQTFVMPMDRRPELIDRLNKAKLQGLQIFWVCALVSESEALNCQAAEDTYENLLGYLDGFKIGLVHGKQKAEYRQAIMQDFKQGKLDILVATSVIEVGVDIPNAGVMIIDNAERFGLSQLHQLRGRIGRGNKDAFCILLYKRPLSEISKKRLAVIRNNTDGFKIAQADLNLRGEGDILGKLQSGRANFRIADIFRDYQYLEQIREIADNFDDKTAISELLQRWKLEVLFS